MKTGRSLQDLAIEIERQMQTKKDYIAPTDKVQLLVAEQQQPIPTLQMKLGDLVPLNVGDIAHDQIAGHTGIPRPYYDRMLRESPVLLATNIDHWFKAKPTNNLFRTLDGRVRSFHSDKFRTLDNYDYMGAVLPVLRDRKLTIMSCEVTEKRLYLKVVDEQLFRDVPIGYKMGDGSHKFFETCAPAAILSNSEVGYGQLVLETGVYTSACTNLALFAGGGMKRRHVGARHKMTEGMDVEDLENVLSQKTKQKTAEALWMQVRDVLASAFDEKTVAKRVEQYEAAAGRRITKKVDSVMEVVQERFSLNDQERESIFKHLIEGGQLNQYGLHAAVTRSAQDVLDYDRATELEYLGGRIIELPRTEWSELAEAA